MTEARPELEPNNNLAKIIPIIENPAPMKKDKLNFFSNQLSGNKCSNTIMK